MGEATSIEWTDNTFNPWWGCVRVSEACRNCYAETFDRRVAGKGHEHWGPGAPRRFFGDKHWNEPRKWNERAEKRGVRERVFCASMADVFEDREDLVEHRERLWKLIAATPHLDWLLLTKRPENFERMLPWFEAPHFWRFTPWPNVWLGVTAETQADYDRRVEILCRTPAVVRFVSMEPLLERVTLRGFGNVLPDWFIVGGESGPGSRPMHPDWARSVRDQVRRRRIETDDDGPAFLFKQFGEYGPTAVDMRSGADVFRSFATKSEWVNKGRGWICRGDVCVGADGRVLQRGADFDDPSVYPVAVMRRVGKKAAGRALDGRTWDEFPLPRAP